MLITAANQNKLKLLPIYIIDKYRRVFAASEAARQRYRQVQKIKLRVTATTIKSKMTIPAMTSL